MDLLKKTYYLTEMHAEGLYALSLKYKVSQSEVVRRAIEKYIAAVFPRHKTAPEKNVSKLKQIWRKFISNRN
jgi:hypothetical protein